MLSRFGSLANLVEREAALSCSTTSLATWRAACGGREQRLALLVVDGLAIDQWLVIRDALAAASPTLRMDESACLRVGADHDRRLAARRSSPVRFLFCLQTRWERLRRRRSTGDASGKTRTCRRFRSAIGGVWVPLVDLRSTI